MHAPTGMGKTWAAWLGPVAFGEPGAAGAPPPLAVLWITPLRALAADTGLALARAAAALQPHWTVDVRTGDTASGARARQDRRLPTALVTTPESLTLLLSRADWRERFAHLTTVVVDEWHELLASKRGVQVELALARLRGAARRAARWGLSATLANLDEALACLLGPRGAPAGRIVKGLDAKTVVIDTLRPKTIERFPWAGHIGLRLLPEVIRAIERARSTLVFTNVRSQTEIWYQALLAARPDWAGLDRAAPRLARARGARLGRGRPARRQAARRGLHVQSRSRRRFRARRPGDPDRQSEGRRAPAAARRTQRAPARRDIAGHRRADARARADRGGRGTRRRRPSASWSRDRPWRDRSTC